MDAFPMFPLGAVLLPGEPLSLQVFEPRYLTMVDECTSSPDRMRFGVVLISRGHEVGGGDERTDVGTVARIVSARPVAGGRVLLECRGAGRIRILDWLADDPYPRARVRDWPDEPGAVGDGVLDAVTDRVTSLGEVLGALAGRVGRPAPVLPMLADLPGDAGEQTYALAARLPLGAADRRRVLSAPGPGERLEALAEALDDVLAAARFRLAQ
ncbi:LON peptidase substrate-binding domain-containing protein [Rhodococcus kronopolitis]|uniref:LON peptidase substrate-binding domain-containing protein n=1 Tax=Rhodococcus kronopolitis TaxID=1460226 RepID=A0ABV9FKT0_9NOCA